MPVVNKKEPLILFLGDILFFVISLWLTLVIRYFNFPNQDLWGDHLYAFSALFIFWFISFYVAGLYKKQTLILQNSLPKILFNTQIINIFMAVLFFYFIPYFSIAPKTNLFIYLVISFGLIYFWRLYLINFILRPKKQKAILISHGQVMQELSHEINNNNRYGIFFSEQIDLEITNQEILNQKITNAVENQSVSIIVTDFNHQKTEVVLPELYELLFKKVQFVNTYDLYEYLFEKVPLSMMSYGWFIRNISTKNQITYDFLKRIMDIFISVFLFIPSLLIYPFVILAIWLETKNNPFIVQERIGKDNKKIKLYKFRSMISNDKGKWVTNQDNRITKVGKILRISRIDELPQLLNVLKGDISLIGPRPDIIGLFDDLNQKLSYYTIRNIVKPGLSGWAQTHQETPPHSLEETKIRLSYDLFYIKNRSFVLDLKIALQTLKTLISRTGK